MAGLVVAELLPSTTALAAFRGGESGPPVVEQLHRERVDLRVVQVPPITNLAEAQRAGASWGITYSAKHSSDSSVIAGCPIAS